MPELAQAPIPAEHRTSRLQLAIRLCGFTLGAICTGALMLGVFLHLSFSGRQIEADLVEYAERNWQRNLSLATPPRLHLWPRLELEFDALALSEPGRSETFASWRKARIEPGLRALLRGQLQVQRIEIDGLLLRLTRDRKGVWNSADILQERTAQPFSLLIDGLLLRQADITIEDQQSGRTAQWRKLDLASDAVQPGKGGRVQLETQLVIGKPGVEGKLVLGARYRVDQSLASGALLQARAGFKGRAAWASEAQIDASLTALEWQAGVWQLRQAALEASTSSGAEPLRLNASLPAARWQGGLQAALLELAVQRGERSTAKLEFAQLQSDAGDSSLIKGALNAEANGGGGGGGGKDQGKLRARLRGPVSIDLDEATLALTQIDGQIDASHSSLRPDLGTTKMQGEMRFDLADTSAQPLIVMRTDFISAAGKLQLEGGASRSAPYQVKARISSDSIDADRIFSSSKWADALPAPEALQGWTLDASAQIARLKLAGLQLEDVQLPVKINDGKIDLADHSATLYGGRLAGRFQWDAGKQRYTASQTLRGVQLAVLARDASLRLPLTGLTNATLEASGSTGPWPAPCSSAQGVLRVYAKPATWQGADLTTSMLTLAPGQQRQAAAEATPFDEVSAALRIAEGTLQIERLTAGSRALNLAGSGKFACNGDAELQLQVRAGSDKAVATLRGQRMVLQVKAAADKVDVMRDAAPVAVLR